MHAFERSFNLGTKPRKPPLTGPLNDKSRQVCFDINFSLSYFNIQQQTFTDRSTKNVVKFSIGDAVSFYLNEDEDGTLDVIITGPGLIPDLDIETALSLVALQVQSE